MFYKGVLLVHFVAMIALVGTAGAASILLGLAANGSDDARRPGLGAALDRLNRWLFLPGLVLAPAAGLVLWSRHHWVWPTWLQYKLGLTTFGVVGGLMYLHLFRTEVAGLLSSDRPLDGDSRSALTAIRRAVGAAAIFLLAAAAIGTLKPGW